VAGPEGVGSAWVGDSRAYWLPDEGPGMALTEDDTGEHDALTAWLGADAGPVTAHVRSYRPLVPGRLLLCTDDLWRCLPDAARLRAAPGRRHPDARADARALVGHALDAGGQDNVTAAVIRVVPHPLAVDGAPGSGAAARRAGASCAIGP
jgi:serine/threonine protein phosphatase PrpC